AITMSRVDELIALLGLAPHPEGGFYRETYRSPVAVQCADGRRRRDALTTIYYLLASDEIARWHRVRSDEVWHHYEGDPLELLVAPPDLRNVVRHRLGPARAGTRPSFTVPADSWQAARPLGTYALAGCTVAPGFDFEDFAFLSEDES